MTLVYNIDFDIAAFCFLVVMYFNLVVKYTSESQTSKIFKRMTLATVFLVVFDILSTLALSISGAPAIFTILTTSAYYLTEAVAIAMYSAYVAGQYNQTINSTNPVWIACTTVPLGMFFLCIVINFLSPVIFSVGSDGSLQFGELHFLTYVVPIYYFLLTLVLVILRRKNFPVSHRLAILSFVIIAAGCILIQNFLLPEYLLSCFGVAVSILIMLITLETPDFQKLAITMKELEAAKDEAMAANIAKSAFLANMSHEIRTPINGVLGMNEIILNSEPNDDIKECAENIENAGRSLLAIVNDILDLSKIESGKMEIINGEYNPMELINNVYHMIIFRAKDKHLDFNVEISPDIPTTLFGDEVRIRQILINILTNSVKYTPKGSVTWKMWVESDVQGVTTLYMSVADTGMGIKKEEIPGLFEAFQRADVKKTRSIEGTGLGLRITKQLVDLMEGEIGVESTYGLGSIFTVKIPQSVIDATPMGEFSPRRILTKDVVRAEVPDFSNHTILVVDDIQVNLKVVKGLLKATNINMDLASSGAQALDLMKEHKYDVIFMDHLMPDMDGVETYAESKKMEGNKNLDTPTIMLTANAILGAKEEYMNSGFTDYITKPVKGQDLIDALTKYLPS